jgi:hypothetical protein
MSVRQHDHAYASSLAYPAATVAGNPLYAFISGDTGGTFLAPTDTQGNTWTLGTIHTFGNTRCAWAHTTTNVGGANTVTVGGTLSDPGIHIYECASLSGTPIDIEAFTDVTTTNTTPTSASFTPSAVSTVLVGLADEATAQGTITPGTGYTDAGAEPSHVSAGEYATGVSAAAHTASFTTSNATGGGATIIAVLVLTEASGGTTPVSTSYSPATESIAPVSKSVTPATEILAGLSQSVTDAIAALGFVALSSVVPDEAIGSTSVSSSQAVAAEVIALVTRSVVVSDAVLAAAAASLVTIAEALGWVEPWITIADEAYAPVSSAAIGVATESLLGVNASGVAQLEIIGTAVTAVSASVVVAVEAKGYVGPALAVGAEATTIASASLVASLEQLSPVTVQQVAAIEQLLAVAAAAPVVPLEALSRVATVLVVSTEAEGLTVVSVRANYGGLALSLGGALRPAMRSVLGRFGFNAAFYVPTRVRQPNASTIEGWAAIAAAADLAVVVADISAAQAIRSWGTAEDITAEATVVWPDNLALNSGMGFVMTRGPRAGQSFIVTAYRFDDITRIATLAVFTSPKRSVG